jgi:hypothetical protein
MGGCAPCEPGEQPDPPQAGCVTCGSLDPTFFSADGRGCRVCRHGTQPDPLNLERPAACMRCPRGEAGTHGACAACPGGTEPNQIKTRCMTCGAGKYNTDGEQVIAAPSWPGIWANFSPLQLHSRKLGLLQLHSHRNARASVHRVGPPDACLARSAASASAPAAAPSRRWSRA